MANVLGPFVAFVEFFGGLALIFGLLSRLAAFGIASTMVVAILQVHLKNGFFAPMGVEFPLSLLGSTIMLGITGAGSWSLDSLVRSTTQVVDAGGEQVALRRAA
jgi:putative oxidoreductase